MLHSNFGAKHGTRKENEKVFQIRKNLLVLEKWKWKKDYLDQLHNIWQTWMAYYKKHFIKILKIEVVFQTLNSQCHDFENRNLWIYKQKNDVKNIKLSNCDFKGK